MNHRSAGFIDLSRKTVALLKEKLKIPEDYTVFFTSSATECWEIIAQSLVVTKSIHIHNGAFGEKWYDYTHRLQPEAQSLPFDPGEALVAKDLIFKDGDLICITQNETSNGTQVSAKIIAAVKKNNPDHLVAVDATSSMAGIYLNFKTADIWFASVQKCFGLPAGLAVMICSPRAIRQMETIGERSYYNSLSFMKEMMDKWQTPYTPNVLGIYLLKRALKKMDKITAVDQKLTQRHTAWVRFFKNSKDLQLLVARPEVQSKTVIAVKGNSKLVDTLKAAAQKKGLLVGEGYGNLKKETFRIANFPALKKKEITKLMNFLRKFI
jgi:phosphoserine aminotransferase